MMTSRTLGARVRDSFLSSSKKIASLTLGFTALAALQTHAQNGTILQAFDWETPAGGVHWNRLANEAQDWADRGITAFWLPPAYKGSSELDVGYGAYDLWDLGEFPQKGRGPTKYGTKNQYLNLIDAIHATGAKVYADIVINHKANADSTDRHSAVRVYNNNRNYEFGSDINITTYSKFTFPGRRDRVSGELAYNDFVWRWYHFDGSDYSVEYDVCGGCIYKFRGSGKNWDAGVSGENGNYDYLLGSDIDYGHPEVRAHLKEWGTWYTTIAKLDGFRLDATKHISATWFNEWLFHVRQSTGRGDLFSVSEYWETDVNALNTYTNTVNGGNNRMSVFDVPLHQNFHLASTANGFYDMGSIYNNTLVSRQPARAATFVDNHDSLNGPERSLSSQVADWFKPLAYAMILLRRDGYPTVFLGDYDGVPGKVTSHKYLLDRFMKARKHHAYGVENRYFDDRDVVGFTREGNGQHWYGVAVLMSDGGDGRKWMKAGAAHANQCFSDITGHINYQVCANRDGWANFATKGKSVSIWVRNGKFGRNRN